MFKYEWVHIYSHCQKYADKNFNYLKPVLFGDAPTFCRVRQKYTNMPYYSYIRYFEKYAKEEDT